MEYDTRQVITMLSPFDAVREKAPAWVRASRSAWSIGGEDPGWWERCRLIRRRRSAEWIDDPGVFHRADYRLVRRPDRPLGPRRSAEMGARRATGAGGLLRHAGVRSARGGAREAAPATGSGAAARCAGSMHPLAACRENTPHHHRRRWRRPASPHPPPMEHGSASLAPVPAASRRRAVRADVDDAAARLGEALALPEELLGGPCGPISRSSASAFAVLYSSSAESAAATDAASGAASAPTSSKGVARRHDALVHGALPRRQIQDVPIDRALRDEAVHVDGLRLPDAVRAVLGPAVDLGVEVDVVDHDGVRARQINSPRPPARVESRKIFADEVPSLNAATMP